MCKLAGWTSGINNPLTKHYADKALQVAASVIGKSESDGFGFAQTSFRGRFLKPKQFRSIDSLANLRRNAGARAFRAFDVSDTADQTGAYNPQKHFIVHGRTATCGVNLENVHPFRHKGWTLAHNGVVSWNGKETKEHKGASCDSQHLLYCLTDHPNDEQAQKHALREISGYAAFLALSPSGKLTVAVDNRAKLFAGITNKKRWIFGTTPDIVEAVADAWNCSNVRAFQLADWTWLSFPTSGGQPRISEWHHAEATRSELAWSGSSLGYPSAHSYDRRNRYDTGQYSSAMRGAYSEGGYSSYGGSRGTEPVSQHNLDDDTRKIVGLTTDELFDEKDMGVPAWKGDE
jgi:hypothetical protein